MLAALGAVLIFFLKVLIIVLAVIIVVSFIVSIAAKQKAQPDTDKFTIKHLNKELDQNLNRLKSKTLEEKEAKKLKKTEKKKNKKATPRKDSKIFVVDFNGDIKASAADNLKKIVTQIIQMADPKKDQVLLRLESPGGMVSGYGLAASELSRLRDKKIELIVAVDKVAASGGYLMSCVANEIIAAPFAVVGSIGVVASMPNFNKLLKKNHIDYEVLTAGKYKRTLTMFGENTEEARKKFLDQLEQIHKLFKNFVSKYRPQLDIESVATGDYWFGEDALEQKLVDKIQTSEDYILSKSNTHELYLLDIKEKKKLTEKLLEAATLAGKRINEKSPHDFI